MGSDVSAAQAVQLYSDLLCKAGWTAEGIQDAESPVLIQGDHTRLNLHSGNPGVDVQDVVDYRQIQATHRTIVTVRVDYLLPQQDGC
jgi:hypothetical protein